MWRLTEFTSGAYHGCDWQFVNLIGVVIVFPSLARYLVRTPTTPGQTLANRGNRDSRSRRHRCRYET
jgi:hypothetical protein